MYADYSMTEKRKIWKLLEMDGLEISRFSIFVGHRYLQHVGIGWHHYYALWYHTYLIPASYYFMDAVASAYSSIFSGRRPSPSTIEEYSGQKTEGKRERVEKVHDVGDENEKGGGAESTGLYRFRIERFGILRFLTIRM